MGTPNRLTRTILGTALSLAVVAALEACGTPPDATQSSSPTATPSATPTDAPTLTPIASPSATSSAADDAPAGWTRAHGEGFSIAVPDDWEPLSAADLVDGNVIDAMRDANPDAGAVLDQAETALESGQFALFAFDAGPRTAENGFAANVNVIPVTDVGGNDLQEAATAMADVIRLQIPVVGEISTSTASLPAGDAAVISYHWTLGLPNGESAEVAVTQYLVVTGADGYILTMSGIGADSGQDTATWEQMADTFREE